jgi:NitT/TauT family transport system permease protein
VTTGEQIQSRPLLRKRKQPSTLRRTLGGDWLYPLGALVLFILLWDLSVRIFDIKPFILPSPLRVLSAMVEEFPTLFPQAWYTLQEVLAGFGISVAVGIPLALAIVSFRVIEKSLYPLLVASQVIPKIAVAPLFILWFGFGTTPKIVVAFLIAFFPVVVDTVVGLKSVEIEKLYLARSMGASSFQTFFKFRLPHAMPNVFGGLKLAITFAVTGAIVGEFIGADRGIGRVLLVANGNLDTPLMFAAVTLLSLMGIALFLVVEIIERFTIRWHVSQRTTHVGGV